MITNHLLDEKERVQKELAEEVQYDMKKYTENIHRIVLEAQAKYGLKLRYGQREGGTIDIFKL
jgi:hypothetical protein